MLTAVLCPPTMADLQKELACFAQCAPQKFDNAHDTHKQHDAHETCTMQDKHLYEALELRLDFCNDVTPARFPPLPLPTIITLRSQKHGGVFQGTEEERITLMKELMASLKPAYLDVEDSVPTSIMSELHELSPKTTLIISHHDFTRTPDLDTLLAAMQQVFPPKPRVLYKIACQANSTLDALTMLQFCRRHHKKLHTMGSGLVGISMGSFGETTRILAPVIHHGICYCPTSTTTAPGQIDAATLTDIYNTPALTPKTALYGLLGDPVDQSQGHIFHNRRNKQGSVNAVYVKWQVTKDELPKALELLYDIGVRGLSLTMPLKETGAALCQTPVGSPYQAINTLRSKVTSPKAHDGGMALSPVPTTPLSGNSSDASPQKQRSNHSIQMHWEGCNTDGEGALRSLHRPVYQKKVIVIGAGGASLALLIALQENGAVPLVYNRSAKPLPYNTPIRPLEELIDTPLPSHDIIINTLPFTLSFPFERIQFSKKALAFDISYAQPSPFLAAAQKVGCEILTGQGMFEEQALLQRAFWGLL